jgi:protein SCO1/2
MTERPATEPVEPAPVVRPPAAQPPPPPIDRRAAAVGAVVLGIVVLLGAGLVGLVALQRSGGLPTAAPATPGPGDVVVFDDPQPAPPLALTDQDGQPFTLESLRGRPVLLFFGYTHCPDVCPTTIGTVTEVLGQVGYGPRAVFTSIDPERDDVAAMKSYLQYLHPAFMALTGSPADIRTMADAWGVKYAKIETGSAGGYAMAHTADTYLVDAQGRLRAVVPFGTEAAVIAEQVEKLLAETPPPSEAPPTPPTAPTPAPTGGACCGRPTAAPPTPSPSPAASGALAPMVVSSSVWSGGGSPVILKVSDDAGTLLDGTRRLRARVVSAVDGSPAGEAVPVTAVRPPGEDETFHVASLDFPSPGTWRIELVADDGATGSVPVNAMDPGSTAAIGSPAPDVRTPTLDDVGGLALAVTTQPQPDLRMSQTSTADARAAGKPYVLVMDSARFKVSPACGRALTMVRYLLDRWTGVPFIHLEPFEYSIVTNDAVLNGDLADPPLNDQARAFGIGPEPWTGVDMPWIFVVDGDGIVRAKYTGIVGSADVDVILSLVEGEGVIE